MTDLPTIIHLDDCVIAVDKPAGLLSVPGIGPENADCVAARVAAAHPGARIVHRLDMATSGVMVLALDAESHRRLSWQFERRSVVKRYIAVVEGVVAEDAGAIELPLRKDLTRKTRHIVDHLRGKPALTEWRVLERDAGARRTRIELRPRTGRSHQLRVHLAAIGHPIVGDGFYGVSAEAADRLGDGVPCPARLLLHSAELLIRHPSDDRELRLVARVPF
ncbi:MAG TPA: RluA family pseudouridine synthase [Phycisphaerales bacterium]|nr:RluA family pseudouridine synthase [Phycisphaerales bacterium]HMP37639.1 RluA family pseudouridine synthase [Phycisphaerales bacterium]